MISGQTFFGYYGDHGAPEMENIGNINDHGTFLIFTKEYDV